MDDVDDDSSRLPQGRPPEWHPIAVLGISLPSDQAFRRAMALPRASSALRMGEWFRPYTRSERDRRD
jgi:hypothetical protein